jgi:adenylate cyclase class 2
MLEAAGYRPEHERAFEANTVFDTADRSLMGRRQLLRLREFRGKSILTFKGSPLEGPHKARPEFETELASAPAFARILDGLGYSPQFRYEKYRTLFGRSGDAGHVCLDETPMGVFLELEGAPDWIDATAHLLGFRPEDYVTLSYGSLWREFCLKQGMAAVDMRFDSKDGMSDRGGPA